MKIKMMFVMINVDDDYIDDVDVDDDGYLYPRQQQQQQQPVVLSQPASVAWVT